MDRTCIVRETIETHTGDLCPIADGDIAEALDLMGGDITAVTVEEAFAEVVGDPGWDDRLYEDIASALLEDSAGMAA